MKKSAVLVALLLVPSLASAAETPVDVLTGEYLPLLLQTAGAISADWAACQAAPQVTVPQPATPQPAPQPLALP